jgi:exosortase
MSLPAGTHASVLTGPPYRILGFVALSLVALIVFRGPLSALAALALQDDRYTHTVLMPFLSVGLIYLHRKRIFAGSEYCARFGIPGILAGFGLFGLANWWPPLASLPISLIALAIILISTFLVFYGTASFRAALSPLFFVFLAVPIPSPVVEQAQIALQKATAEMTDILFRMASTPVFRDGLQFSLPGFTVEVARECSGIRSSIALAITGLVLGQLFLRSPWTRAFLLLSTVPIAIVKNALRVATISWLGTYVSKDYLFGDLHHRGGPLFSVISLALLLPLLFVLMKWERRTTKKYV